MNPIKSASSHKSKLLISFPLYIMERPFDSYLCILVCCLLMFLLPYHLHCHSCYLWQQSGRIQHLTMGCNKMPQLVDHPRLHGWRKWWTREPPDAGSGLGYVTSNTRESGRQEADAAETAARMSLRMSTTVGNVEGDARLHGNAVVDCALIRI